MKRLLIGLLIAPSAFADSVLVTNANLMSMGPLGTQHGVSVLIEDDVIADIGTNITTVADTVIDANGAIVTPALFAGATATGLVEVNAVRESADGSMSDTKDNTVQVGFDVRDAYSPMSSVVGVTRVEGFGYSLLMASGGQYSVAGRGSLVDFDGGFESFNGSDVLFVDVGGYAADKVGGSRAAHWMLLDGIMADLKRRSSEREYLSQSGKEHLKDLTKNGVFVFSANRAADIRKVISFSNEYRLNSVITGGREAWLLADELAAADIPVMVNGLDNLPSNFDALGSRLDNAALLHDAGVQVLFTSGETHNARKVRQGAGAAVAHGMPHEAAVEAMTTTPSRVFGGRVRALEVGNRADMVIWSGDPLEVTSYATSVILKGEVTSMATRQSKLLERYLPEDAGLGRAYINR
ncbi:amidohydrolase [Candidatus Paraluminiphilus aquimaris]|uniref:Amidohydrolase n=1 Tax=Candidatus Paraluminiphilus aquimaris TaxID=2518994 RepID=A0ABY6Q9M2_9GAMM|nr:amidohydrolase family protein [Candidatus Paraluminiphilus aquimaris]UZP74913.1 amidohydrolase [Candidatus Paraluminiphilus aquimaris]